MNTYDKEDLEGGIPGQPNSSHQRSMNDPGPNEPQHDVSLTGPTIDVFDVSIRKDDLALGLWLVMLLYVVSNE